MNGIKKRNQKLYLLTSKCTAEKPTLGALLASKEQAFNENKEES